MGRLFRVTRTGALPRALSRHLGDPPPRLLHVVKYDIITFLHPPPLSLPLGVDPEHLSPAMVQLLQVVCQAVPVPTVANTAVLVDPP